MWFYLSFSTLVSWDFRSLMMMASVALSSVDVLFSFTVVVGVVKDPVGVIMGEDVLLSPSFSLILLNI